MTVELSGIHSIQNFEYQRKASEIKGEEIINPPQLEKLKTIISLAEKRKSVCCKMKCAWLASLAFLSSAGGLIQVSTDGLIQNFTEENLTSPIACAGLALLGLGALTLSVAAYSTCRGFFLGRTIIRINREIYKTQIPTIKNRGDFTGFSLSNDLDSNEGQSPISHSQAPP